MKHSILVFGISIHLLVAPASGWATSDSSKRENKSSAKTSSSMSGEARLREIEKNLEEMQETIRRLTAELARLRLTSDQQATVPTNEKPPLPSILGAETAAPNGVATLIEQQREVIERQQKQLEELEKRLASVKANPDATALPPAAAPATQAPPPVTNSVSKEITREGFGIKFYGFLRGDLAADTDRMSFDTQLPFFVLSPVDPSQAMERTGDLTIHPRLTRFGVEINPPSLPSGWSATAKLETDFYNAVIDRPAADGPAAKDLVSNSRAAIRIRLAYVQLSKGAFSLLAGQTWDTISPLFPSYNPEVVMWNGGNTGDRRPQFRLSYEPKVGKGKFSIAGEIGASGAVDGQDLDGDGFRDGETAIAPTGQLRIGYSAPLNGQTWSIGVWGHGAQQQVNRRIIAGRDEFTSNLVGFDISLPLHARLTVKGEAWTGKGLGDVRGGIGQSINTATGRVIHASGGWAEVAFKASSFYTISGGTALDSPDASDITAANGRVRNRVHYITNRFNAGRGLSFGFDYGRWETRFKALPRGTNNRFNLYVQQAF